MEFLLSRPVVIGFAVAGGVFSAAAIVLRKRPGRDVLARQTDLAGYALMGISMLLFIIVGLRGQS